MATGLSSPSWEEIDPFVEAFERNRTSGGREGLAHHLPPPTHPHYLDVLRELVRVDLEFSWADGRPLQVEDYLNDFPELRDDSQGIQAIAFEEYRLRRRAGENPSPTEYHRRLGVSTLDWPGPLPGRGANGRSGPPVDDDYAELLQELRGADPDTAHRIAGALTNLPESGETFLDFQLVKELGRGAFGRVYLARQGKLADRQVALKLSVDLLGEPLALAQLQHTHVVPIYSAHYQPPLQALCMPYFGATTLADVLTARRALPRAPESGQWLADLLAARARGEGATRLAPDAARRLAGAGYVQAVLWLGTCLAEGLTHAHERGIIHGDLKPANVLLSDEGRPMLLDFNLARDTKLVGRASVALLGGTLPYMAPEQLAAFRDATSTVDPRSDIYSLGLILYELLSGRYPFPLRKGRVEDLLVPMLDDRAGPPPDVRQWNPTVSPAESAILRHCLEPDPSRRYPSARALHEDLELHLANRPLKHQTEPLSERLRKWLRRHPRLAIYAVTAVALLMVLALGSLYVRRGRQLAKAEAYETLHRFDDERRTVQFLLGGPDPDPRDLWQGVDLAEASLGRYGILDNPDWQSRSQFTALSTEEGKRLRGDMGDELLFLARGLGLQALAPANAAKRADYLQKALSINSLAESCLGSEETMRPVLLQRAFLLHENGQEAEARTAADRAQALPTRSVRDRYHLALAKMREGDYQAAEELLQQAREDAPQDPFIWYQLGLCAAGRSRSQEAIARFDTSLALWPQFYGSYYQRGRSHADLREPAQAVADFDTVLRLQPDFLPAYFDRALARLKTKDAAGALADLNHLIDAGPPQTRVFFARAEVRTGLGDAEGASRDRAEGLRREPGDEISWVVRGVHRLGPDPSGALSDFEEALKLNPRSLPALEDKAHVLAERLGRTADAVAVLSRVVELYPERASARASRGVLQARLGQREAALADAEEALRLDVEPATKYQVAGIYALTSRTNPDDRDRAFQLLSAALRAGYGFDLLASDPDLEPIRARPEFQRLVDAARALQPTPVR
jgi:serine/threonine protein kinase/predicted Zn-dependent protease